MDPHQPNRVQRSVHPGMQALGIEAPQLSLMVSIAD